MASKSKSASTSTIAGSSVTAQVVQPHGPPTASELSRSQLFNSAEMQGYTIIAELIVCSAPSITKHGSTGMVQVQHHRFHTFEKSHYHFQFQ